MPAISPVIVIANHDKAYLALIQELLTEQGYEVFVADGGAKTYELIRQKQPDLAILDLPVRYLDSVFTTVTMLRVDPTLKNIPIILCSLHTDLIRDNRAQLQSMKCQILAKPFYFDTLLEVIHSSLSFSPADQADARDNQ